MFLYDKFKKNKCLYISLLIYHIFNLIDFWGEYKINIIVVFYNRYPDRGHAWVTRNGKNFLLKNDSVKLSELETLGLSKKYNYWIKSSNTETYLERMNIKQHGKPILNT